MSKLFSRLKDALTLNFSPTIDHNNNIFEKISARLHHMLNYLPTFNVDIEDAVTVQSFSEVFPEYIAKAYGSPTDLLSRSFNIPILEDSAVDVNTPLYQVRWLF